MKKKENNEMQERCPEDTCAEIIAEAEILQETLKTPEKKKRQKKKLSTREKIYKFLDAAEKVAIVLKTNQNAKKKKAKKQLKKDKKIGKIDKKTGAVVLKKVKKDKVQKPMKRYKPPKKK